MVPCLCSSLHHAGMLSPHLHLLKCIPCSSSIRSSNKSGPNPHFDRNSFPPESPPPLHLSNDFYPFYFVSELLAHLPLHKLPVSILIFPASSAVRAQICDTNATNKLPLPQILSQELVTRRSRNSRESVLGVRSGSSGSSDIPFLGAAVEVVRVAASNAGRAHCVFQGSSWGRCVLVVPVLWYCLALPLAVPPVFIPLASGSSAFPLMENFPVLFQEIP